MKASFVLLFYRSGSNTAVIKQQRISKPHFTVYLQQVALVRVSFDEQPVQGGGQTRSRQVIDALQLPRSCRRLDVQPPSAVSELRECPETERSEPGSPS